MEHTEDMAEINKELDGAPDASKDAKAAFPWASEQALWVWPCDRSGWDLAAYRQAANALPPPGTSISRDRPFCSCIVCRTPLRLQWCLFQPKTASRMFRPLSETAFLSD